MYTRGIISWNCTGRVKMYNRRFQQCTVNSMQLFDQILSKYYVRNNVYLSINADVGRYFKMYK